MKGLENVKSSQLKKVQYKDGGVVADFFDVDGNQITVKSVDVPHPDFRNAFANLKPYIITLLCLNESDGVRIEPTAVECKSESGIYVLRGLITSEFTTSEFKTDPLIYASLKDTPIYEAFDVIEAIKDETHKFLFEGKEAQQSLFPPMQNDGADGARALLSMTGTN